jgi:hypothetical protein
MLTQHFEDKLAVVKHRTLILEYANIPYQDKHRLDGLIKEADGKLPLSARNAFLDEAIDILNNIDTWLRKESTST